MLNFLKSPQLCQLTILFLHSPSFPPMKRFPLELFLKSRKQSFLRPCFPSPLFLFFFSQFLFYFAFPFRCFSLFRSLVSSTGFSVAKSSFSPSALHQSNLIRVRSLLFRPIGLTSHGFSFICTRACGEAPRQLLLWTNGNLNNLAGKPR